MACKLLNSLSLLAASFILFSCANGAAVNQGTPAGTLVATGTMSGSASANVGVYSQGSGTYAVQLAALSYSAATCGAGTNVGVVAGSYVSGPPLTSTSGTTNYTLTGLSGTPTSVFLYCRGSSPISSGIVAQTISLNPA